ncbi:MAG: PQQ-dependent sugar dehydrogenase [Chloroflexota bacterium]
MLQNKVCLNWLIGLVVILVLIGCQPTPSPTPTPAPTLAPVATPNLPPTLTPIPHTAYALHSEVVEKDTGLVVVLAFDPDGRLFYATQDGQIFTKIINPDAVWESPPSQALVSIEVSRQGNEDGLLGLALSPNFAENHHFFVYHTYPNAAGRPAGGRIVRYTESDNRAIEETIIVDNLPVQPEQLFHFGGGLNFGPDGKLYLIFGDTNDTKAAQDLNRLPGSILRYNPDGSIPADNPFPNSPVYAYGIRNGFGLTWHPTTQKLYQIDNGTHCDDEINIIEAGSNYGWGAHPWDACPYPDDQGSPPIFEWETIIGPAAATFYQGDILPEFKDNLLLCSYNRSELYHVALDETGQQVQTVEIVDVPDTDFLCRVAVTEGPDGWLYTTTQSVIFRTGRNP